MEQNVELGMLAKGFIDKVENRECKVAVIGLGYVGIPLVIGFNNVGFPVLGVDIDERKVNSLMAGKSDITHISNESIQKMLDTERFEATTDFAKLHEVDAILLCVPTPLNHHREPDLSFVEATTRSIAPYVRPGQIIILESTTYPGTTTEILQPILEQGSGLVANKDFIVAYSPEREDPANPSFITATIPKVVGAATDEGLEMMIALYQAVLEKVVPVSSPETAEAVKLTENIFRAVNIALVNELKLIYGEMGIDVWEVIDAAKTKPFGFMPFYPGPGLGGHCIPIDPFYLTWKAREFDRHTRFIELAGEINTNMPKHVIRMLADGLSMRSQKAVSGAKVLVIGVAYKKNVDDMRESPSLVLMKLLEDQDAEVDFYDPFIPVMPQTREFPQFTDKKSIEWSGEKIAEYDVVLIATEHDSIDWQELTEQAKLVVDTRNATGKLSAELQEKVIKA